MARRRNIEPWVWHLWAAAESGGYPHLGYPSQVPWYQPARLSRIEAVEGDAPRPLVTAEEWRLVDRLTEAIARYRVRRPREVEALVVYEGAYPGAAITLAARCLESGIPTTTCKRMAMRARVAIDGTIAEGACR